MLEKAVVVEAGAGELLLALGDPLGKLRDAVLTYARWLIPDNPKDGQPALSCFQFHVTYPEAWRMFFTDWGALAILVAVAWWMYRRRVLIKL